MKKTLKDLGPVTAVIGAQWGDEGKGKIVDILAKHFDVIARASGGANAGHTIVVKGKKHIFHLLPSGCLYKGKPIVLGNSMVIHLPTLMEEIEVLKKAGVNVVPRLRISPAAHIVFDYHKKIDGVVEDRRIGKNKKKGGIGTTMRGIGPAYADKAYRTGMRMGDLADLSSKEFKCRFQHNASYVHKMFGIRVNSKRELEHVSKARRLLKSRIKDVPSYLHKAIKKKKTILIEGAQATHLDIDHGTYPFVTSSATTIMGALQGLGLPPHLLTSTIGVVKAYCTRVGSGPFITEVKGKRGDELRERGGEYGSTTGRPRRCGWLSVSDLEDAIRLNGFTHLNMTKLDVLDAEKEIPVYDGKKVEKLPGWMESTEGISSFSKLPKKARDYIKYVEKAVGVPVTFIGTGPGRKEMVVR